MARMTTGGGVMGIEGGRPRRRILVLGQQGFQLPVLAVALVKAVRKPPQPTYWAKISCSSGGSKAVLRLQPFQKADGLDVAVEFLSRGAHAQGIVMNAVVVALLRGDFRMQDSRGHFAAVSAYCRGWGKLDGGGPVPAPGQPPVPPAPGCWSAL